MTEGLLQLNTVSGLGAQKLDWASLTTPAGTTHNGLPFGLGIDDDLSLHVEGNASIVFEGLLSVEGSFSLDQLDVSEQVLVDEVRAGAIRGAGIERRMGVVFHPELDRFGDVLAEGLGRNR